jgi:uncharacterized CHY-type Zn-finger protein
MTGFTIPTYQDVFEWDTIMKIICEHCGKLISVISNTHCVICPCCKWEFDLNKDPLQRSMS